MYLIMTTENTSKIAKRGSVKQVLKAVKTACESTKYYLVSEVSGCEIHPNKYGFLIRSKAGKMKQYKRLGSAIKAAQMAE